MTPTVVLDASIAITLVLRQVDAEEIERRLRGWLRSGVELSVPTHFWLETSNALVRRHGLVGAELMEAIHRLDDLGLTTVVVDRPLVLLAIDRAERLGLTTYDATYLALAELLDAKLFTSDRQLLSAAGDRALSPASSSERRLSEMVAPYGTEQRPTWPDYSGASAYLARLRAEATESSHAASEGRT